MELFWGRVYLKMTQGLLLGGRGFVSEVAVSEVSQGKSWGKKAIVGLQEGRGIWA